jgi:hypothetical protein
MLPRESQGCLRLRILLPRQSKDRIVHQNHHHDRVFYDVYLRVSTNYHVHKTVKGRTVLGCLIGRMLYCSGGRCRVFLGYVFSRVWRGNKSAA